MYRWERSCVDSQQSLSLEMSSDGQRKLSCSLRSRQLVFTVWSLTPFILPLCNFWGVGGGGLQWFCLQAVTFCFCLLVALIKKEWKKQNKCPLNSTEPTFKFSLPDGNNRNLMRASERACLSSLPARLTWWRWKPPRPPHQSLGRYWL